MSLLDTEQDLKKHTMTHNYHYSVEDIYIPPVFSFPRVVFSVYCRSDPVSPQRSLKEAETSGSVKKIFEMCPRWRQDEKLSSFWVTNCIPAGAVFSGRPFPAAGEHVETLQATLQAAD